MITTEEIKEASGNIFSEYVSKIVRADKPYVHKYYKKTVVHAEDMSVHVEGTKPVKLLEEKRPNEPQAVKDYRLNIWKPVTASLSGKVINTINRIFNPKLFRVQFPDNPSIIPYKEEMSKYLTEDYGIYGSIWVFIRETLLTKTLSDPNAVCLVLPENMEADYSEFYEPLPTLIDSKYVVDFKDGYYYTFYYKPDHRNGIPGKICIVTSESYREWIVKGTDEVVLHKNFEYDLPIVPAFRLGGVVEGDYPNWFKSFISPVQAHWDKVVTMTSDLDGSLVNHIFPERYEWTDECSTCAGSGQVEVEVNLGIAKERQTKYRNCARCGGQGVVANRSPYGVYSVRRDSLTPEAQLPIPPAGYIPKDIEPVRELVSRIDDEIYKGYSSINMEVLHRVGENQSGVAKAIDRQDLESFLMRIANHVFDYQVKNILTITAYWRLPIIGESQLVEYVNNISISKPKEFNVFSMTMLMEELKMASTANVSSNYYKQIETELINNKFANNEQEKKKNLVIIRLKPFPNKTIDQLMSASAIGAVREIDVIRNENIDELVEKAIEMSDTFLDLSFTQQLEIINGIITSEYLSSDETTQIPVEPPTE